jgi:hypothetical protein
MKKFLVLLAAIAALAIPVAASANGGQSNHQSSFTGQSSSAHGWFLGVSGNAAGTDQGAAQIGNGNQSSTQSSTTVQGSSATGGVAISGNVAGTSQGLFQLAFGGGGHH